VKAQVELPKAFSVREENEFYPIQHLMARLNPRLVVTQAGTGVHVNGGCTVFWGVVHLEGQSPSRKEVEGVLRVIVSMSPSSVWRRGEPLLSFQSFRLRNSSVSSNILSRTLCFLWVSCCGEKVLTGLAEDSIIGTPPHRTGRLKPTTQT